MTQASPVKSPGKIFSVGVIGVGEKGLEILHRIFGITRYRQRTYELIAVNDVSSPESMGALKNADIFLLNVNNPQAVLAWRRFYLELRPERRKPVLQLNQNSSIAVSAAEFTIPWPLNPAKLLQTLDNYTIRYLDYYPEFEIGADIEPSLGVVQNVKATTALAPANAPDPSAARQMRVLVADDSLAVRRQLKIEFDSMSAHLESVADGDAAVAAASHQQYDLIFLDVVMPGLDGYAACKLIRRTPLNKHTPIIMLTSRSSRFDKLKGVLAGCDTYLTKPVNHNEFKAVTRKHLEEKRAE